MIAPFHLQQAAVKKGTAPKGWDSKRSAEKMRSLFRFNFQVTSSQIPS